VTRRRIWFLTHTVLILMANSPEPKWIEHDEEFFHRCMEIFSEDSFDLCEEGLNVWAGRFDEELTLVFSDIAAEKIKTIIDVSNARFIL
jgi:hypothetical protein